MGDMDKVLDAATKMFGGDSEAAENWMSAPCKALSNWTPREKVFSGELGEEEVLALIGRLEHGVFS